MKRINEIMFYIVIIFILVRTRITRRFSISEKAKMFLNSIVKEDMTNYFYEVVESMQLRTEDYKHVQYYYLFKSHETNDEFTLRSLLNVCYGFNISHIKFVNSAALGKANGLCTIDNRVVVNTHDRPVEEILRTILHEGRHTQQTPEWRDLCRNSFAYECRPTEVDAKEYADSYLDTIISKYENKTAIGKLINKAIKNSTDCLVNYEL